MVERVGFIGLGDIGLPMAKCLVKRGFQVTVCGHVRRQPVEEMKREGAAEAASPREVARASEVFISMVVDEAQTEEVLRGAQGALGGLSSGSVLVLMSTVSPAYCQRVAADCAQRGIGFLDAPVSGGSRGAEAGKLSVMVGGEEAVLERCRPVIEAMGNKIFHFGGVGMGEVAKLVNNTMSMVNFFVACEVLTLGIRAGIPMERLFPMLRVSSGNSVAIQSWDHLAWIRNQERTGARPDLMHKDLGLALELALGLGVEMPIIRTAMKQDPSPPMPG